MSNLNQANKPNQTYVEVQLCFEIADFTGMSQRYIQWSYAGYETGYIT